MTKADEQLLSDLRRYLTSVRVRTLTWQTYLKAGDQKDKDAHDKAEAETREHYARIQRTLTMYEIEQRNQ